MDILQADSNRHQADFSALALGRHGNPFAVLGVHRSGQARVVRTLQPHALRVHLLDRQGNPLTAMTRVHPAGIFSAMLPGRLRRYLIQVTTHAGTTLVLEDPYCFPSTLGELDLHLLGEGTHLQLYRLLGAQTLQLRGIAGTRFAVWAPNARRVSVIGDFNDWDGRRHPLRLHPANGVWEIFIPGVTDGHLYKFELCDQRGHLLPVKTDPLAHYYEAPPGNAAIIFNTAYQWQDSEWMARRSHEAKLDQPVAIYEVHAGSWRRVPEDHNRSLSYRELADQLVSYVTEMGFTHIELLPITEHPFAGSWGYQPIGLFAPTQRFGTPDDFRYLVDRCHAAGIGVILDWVPAHFPRDEHGLARFDGTALYEHADPRRGEHADWGTLIFNYGRREVCNYLLASAVWWVEEFHIDALRVDAVASMLYLDYSREPGEWLPNEHGGNENLEAIRFLQRLNEELHARGATTYAEESTAWPAVSRPTWMGGLGFTYKWNMGWMHDTLEYISEEPVHRKYHHDRMTFGLVYAFNENFVLPLSHDEVVHGKRSLLGRMPGDEWQQFANLRAYIACMYCHPGKKLLFMGSELAQRDEWHHDRSLDWHLLQHSPHSGMQALVRDLNRIYSRTPALHQIDFEPSGFSWLSLDDRDNSVLAWLRRDRAGRFVLCVTNFTPVVRYSYRIGTPCSGNHVEMLNTDADPYGGSGLCNTVMTAMDLPWHGQPYSLELTLPPLATLILGSADTATSNTENRK